MECVIAPGADALLCINWLGDSRVTLTGERDSLQWPKLVRIFFSENLFSTHNQSQIKEHREKNETHHLLVSSAHIVGSGQSKEHREKNETHHLLSLCLSLRSLLCITSHYLNTWNRVKCNFGIMLRYKR